MSLTSLLSLAALLLTSAIAVVSLVKESQERQEKQEKIVRRWHWHTRLVLTVAGLLTGAVLVFLAEAGKKDAELKHGQEVAGLNQAIETQTQNNENQYLRHQKELRALQDQITDLKKDIATRELRTKMQTLQERLDKAIAPKPKAKLSVSFWPVPKNENLTDTYVPADGNLVTFSFAVVNRSDVYAKDIVLWLQICDACKFHKEPALSQRAPGAPDTERIFRNIDLPPGVQFQQLTTELEIPPPFTKAIMGLSYRCPDCEVESENQQLSITIGRTIPGFLQPQVTKPTKRVR